MTGSRVACGIVAGALVVGVAELVAAPIGGGSAPLAAVGSTVVDRTPDAVREWAIDTFATNDKLVLFVLMGVVAVVVAGLAGVVERGRRPLGSALFAVFGVVAAAAAAGRPGASWTWVLPSVIGAGAGIAALRWSIRRIEAGQRDSVGESPSGAVDSTAAETVDRRRLIRGLVGIGALAAVSGVAGRVIGVNSRNVAPERAAIRLPVPNSPAPPIDPAADLRIPGLAPYLTANSDFYRIDTALIVPQVSTDSWSLRIHGMVDREIRLNYADLASRPAVERVVTLTCVSNPVGGDLIGNARWLGYRLADLIAEAGPHPDADMVLSRSFDGFTAGSPLVALTDGRDALLAVGMNGEPLPVEHGYPARLVVPGLYGYVSATKWVTELEITRFDRAQAYWTKRGWSERGPIKTGTRIDTPGEGKNLRAGKVTVAGVAWAQHRGITAVEVQIDSGPWQPARLAAEPSLDTWRQWAYDWDAAPGQHTIRARATDETGRPQTAEFADVIPDGATGYPSIRVRVA
ncbi:molybdopterin-dependent oxidoreductase [Nocardia pseudobrasiliensis]|uniref:DMSO/TMAO reductase YedYZ molybdopterin-dependent catalytic subunit n=1 Tax=Nocardia pseudobrasiliensis TaxID=45979 RepID=A0A370IER8_9NOCA|nr:molybdopterin-dependent oxidoreductase [Nocardia pseudobrasiliensis]RDI68611.1 DMSO/TMAO reductase YedYZ molybdopterin-dependent catalytic subunit [Nocardia pseudobrasiliensis]